MSVIYQNTATSKTPREAAHAKLGRHWANPPVNTTAAYAVAIRLHKIRGGLVRGRVGHHVQSRKTGVSRLSLST